MDPPLSPSSSVNGVDSESTTPQQQQQFENLADVADFAHSWLELNSEPYVFTNLLHSLGVEQVEVIDIYDIDTNIVEQVKHDRVFGIIFLYHVEDRKVGSKGGATRRQMRQKLVDDRELLDSIFFAHQQIANSCATHALLSVVLNADDSQCRIGPHLTEFKSFCRGMSAENRGYAIGSHPLIAECHNKQGRAAIRKIPKSAGASAGTQAAAAAIANSGSDRIAAQKTHSPSAITTAASNSIKENSAAAAAAAAVTTDSIGRSYTDAYHFVCFVPISGRLIELDGLHERPVDHGTIRQGEHWTEMFRRVCQQRFGCGGARTSTRNAARLQQQAGSQEAEQYTLMAVAEDRRIGMRRLIEEAEAMPGVRTAEDRKRMATLNAELLAEGERHDADEHSRQRFNWSYDAFLSTLGRCLEPAAADTLMAKLYEPPKKK